MIDNTYVRLVSKTDYQKVMEEIVRYPKGRRSTLEHRVLACSFENNFIGNVFNERNFCQKLDFRIAEFISSQTGKGKTTFILETLSPFYQKQGKKILFLGSRTMLSSQVKYEAIKHFQTDQAKTLTDFGIRKEHSFDNMDIYSYQEIYGENVRTEYLETIEKNFSQYGAIVFDEAHFFVSDSDFNLYTEKILKKLTTLAYNHRVARIYMTATPDYVFDSILEQEEKLREKNYYNFSIGYFPCHYHLEICLGERIPFMNFYHFKRNYNYLDLHLTDFEATLDNLDALSQNIVSLVEKSEEATWLVFIDNKEALTKIEKALKKSNIPGIALDSSIIHGTKDEKASETELLLEAINKSNLIPNEYKAIITTKCLDVGVSIKNKNTNIICFLNDPCDFLQAIGRKRVTSKEEKVNLYLPRYTENHVSSWLKQANNTLNNFTKEKHFHPKGKPANGSQCNPPVLIEKGKYDYNSLSFNKLSSKISFYTHLIDVCKTVKNPNLEIARVFAKLLNLEEKFDIIYKKEGDADDKKKHETLLEIIDRYKETPLSEEQLEEFYNELTPFHSKPIRNDRTLGKQGANSILQEVGYVLQKGREGTKLKQI